MAASSTATIRPARRNWLSLSLRTLLLLFSLLAVWVGIIANRAREQRRVVNALSQFPGLIIMYDHEWDLAAGGDSPMPRPLGPLPGWPWLRKMLGDEYFVRVIGASAKASATSNSRTEVPLELLRDIPGLQILVLNQSAVTDADLAGIAGQTELVYLYLDDTEISDAGLAQLHNLKRLRYLYLRHTKVTEEGIAALERRLPHASVFYWPRP